MSQGNTSHRHLPKLSGFEMAETFRMDFQDFLLKFQSAIDILDPLLNHIKSSSPSLLTNYLSQHKLTIDSIPNLTNLLPRAKSLQDYYDYMNNIQAEEKSLQLDSHYEQIEQMRLDLLSHKAQESFLRSQLESTLNKLQNLEQANSEKISSLQKASEDAKAALKDQVDSISDNLKDEKMTRKRMESWFARRLETLNYLIQEMKDKPEKLDLEKILLKIAKLKKKQPWNKNKPNLILDDPSIQPSKPDPNTSGTATPFSHYVCFFSAAASQDNTINQAFIVSADHSMSASQISGGGQWDHLPKSQREMFEIMMKKLNDSNISITEKDKLFCGMFKRDASDSDLRHVKIEDMLDLSRMSNSKDSLSLDMNNALEPVNGKASNQFNHNIKLGGEGKQGSNHQVMSPLLSSIHAKSFLETLKDNIDKSQSFDGQILLDDRKSIIAPSITNRKDEEPQERPSELDKAISNISVSDHNIENMDLRRTQDLKSIRDFLSSHREPANQNDQTKLKDFILSVENRKSQNLVSKGPEMDLSVIEKKKDVNFENKILERLNASDSFLGDEEIKDFLQNAEDREFNFTGCAQVLPITKSEEEPKPCKQKSIKDLSNINILDTFIDNTEQKINESQIRKSTESVISQRKIINDNLSLDTSQTSSHFKRHANAVPSLDFSKIRDRKKPQSLSALPNSNIHIIDSSMNQSSMLEQKPFEDSEDDESENKKTEKPSEKHMGTLKEEKPPMQPTKTPIKFQNQRYLEEADEESHYKKPYYPRRSMDFLPKPPGLPKQNQSRNFSLIEELNKNTPSNTSFEQKFPPAKKGYQLNTSMFNLPGDASFDNSLMKKSNDFGKKSSDYKNNRNSRSFQIQRNMEEKPMSQAAKALGMLIGKASHSSHIRQMTEMSPSTKAQGEHPYHVKSNYQNSFHDKQHSLQINYTHLFNKSGPQDVSNPPSYESTQLAKGLIGKEMLEGSNPLKKVLTYEDSKMYPTPQKPPKREFARRIPNENFNGLNITKDEENSMIGKGLKDKKPISPSKLDDKSKLMNQSVNNGGGHFRAKRFNVKKL